MIDKKKHVIRITPNIKQSIQHLLKIELIKSQEILIENNPYEIEMNFTTDGLLSFGSELIRQALRHKKQWIRNKLFYDMDSKKTYLYQGFHLLKNSPELVPLINDQLQPNKKKSTSQDNETTNNYSIQDNQETYVVNLFPSRKEIAACEKNNKNFAYISIKSRPDHLIYDKESFDKIEMNLTKEGMLHLGETLIRKVILFKNKIKNLALGTKSEILCLEKMGFIYTSENIKVSISINYPDSILENGQAKIKKAIWSKIDSSTYFESIFEEISEYIILKKFNFIINIVKDFLFKNH